MKKINFSRLKAVMAFLIVFLASHMANAQNCSGTHSYECGGACYVDAAQAASAGCTDGSSGGGSDPGDNNNGGGGQDPDACPIQGQIVSGCRTADTQDWCDTNCVTLVGNGNDGCINAEGIFVSRACVCADPGNAIESMIDIEINLGIDIDDSFIAVADYVGAPPPINPVLSYADALTYFQALLGDQGGREFADALNTNGDGIIDRNEASAAKGADPTQTLGTSFGCGLSTDDVLAYVGLYLGDGSIDKYQGNLDSSVKDNMLKFTRTWQPGTDVLACQYRGGCDGSETPIPTPIPVDTPTTEPTPNIPPTATPVPTEPPLPGDPVQYEAESGAILGSAQVYDDGAASGGQGIAFISTQDAGFRLSNVSAASSIEVSYASQVSGKISVRVNGSDAGDIDFAATGAWVGAYASASINLDIPAGATLDIYYDGGDAAMNVDYVIVNSVDDNSTPEPIDTPTVRPTQEPTPIPTDLPTPVPTDEPTPTPTETPVATAEYYYVVHKPTDFRMQSCETQTGTKVGSVTSNQGWHCVQWSRIANGGEYFLLKNRYSSLHLFPESGVAGSGWVLQPNTWTGDWASWSYVETGDGYGYIVNKGTGLQIYLSGSVGAALEARPTSWSGDYTRWKFVPAE